MSARTDPVAAIAATTAKIILLHLILQSTQAKTYGLPILSIAIAH